MTEISIGDYGRMLFEMMLTDKYRLPDHWKSIRKQALPLVRQLLDLNTKMKGGGYEITGYIENGKERLTQLQRILLAQEKLWSVSAESLKIGDRVWVNNYDGHEMVVGECGPARVGDVTARGAYIDMDGCNYEYVVCLPKDVMVLKAPADWEENEDAYGSTTYWLDKANELGI